MYIGVACGTDDTALIPFLHSIYLQGLIQYVELYIQPIVQVSQILQWSKMPFIKTLHAPHGERGELLLPNVEIAKFTAQYFQYKLIVYDPGLKDSGLLYSLPSSFTPENMPLITSLGDTAIEVYPNQMPKRFCLDFAHAWITAGITGKDPHQFVESFLDKKPVHFHLTDIQGREDHVLLGQGEIDLLWIKSKLKDDDWVTLETDYTHKDRQKAFMNDINALRSAK